MINSFNKEIREIKDKVILKEKLTSKLSNMRKELEVKEGNLEKLKSQLMKEQRDVKKLEGLSLGGILAKITGTKADKLEKEEQEYFMAKMRYDEYLMSVNSLKEDIDSISFRIEELGNCEDVFKKLLKDKREELKAKATSKEVAFIEGKEEEINSLIKEYIEIREAIDACNESRVAVNNALDSLKSAENWGTYDIFAGGMFSSMIKHDKVNEGKSYLNELSYSLKRLEDELDDITIDLPVKDLNISSLDYTFDVFFDNIFSDFSIQRKIEDAIYRVDDAKLSIDELHRILNDKLNSVENQIVILQKNLDDIVENM